MAKITVTAVIPTYNCAHLLGRAIESVLAQTRPLNELIVVDDGSKDETQEVVAGFGKDVRYIFQENRGVAAARNRGVAEAKSEWIAFLDSDDEWLPQKIELQEVVARCHLESVLIYSSYYIQTGPGNRRLGRVPTSDRIWPLLRVQNPLATPTVLLRRDLFLDLGGFDAKLHRCEDWDLWVRARLSGPFADVQAPTTVCHVSEHGLTRDTHQMLGDFERILESTLLRGLCGIERRLWRRRARSAQFFSAGITSREIGAHARERKLLVESILQWPSPFWKFERFKALAYTIMN
jgi:glycosyltransferase involved in cell wall biosynthesis